MVTNLVCEESMRNISFLFGYPRRFTLLLDDENRPHVIDELRRDWDIFHELEALGDEWAMRLSRRSVFRKLTVLQVALALKIENFQWTDRLLLR